jgi:hypothetical protein
LKLTLTLRKCWSVWTLAISPTCKSLSPQLGWISKHHVELFKSFYWDVIFSINPGTPKKTNK